MELVNPTFVLNALMMLFVLLGTSINGYFMGVAWRRRALVRRSGENGIANLTMKRAVRNETCFFLAQLSMLVVSIWAMARTAPDGPPQAITFYFVTLFTRCFVAGLLMYCSARDLFDRRKIAKYLNTVHPETPPSEVG